MDDPEPISLSPLEPSGAFVTTHLRPSPRFSTNGHRVQLIALVGVIVPLMAFGGLAEEIWNHEAFTWDTTILEFLHRHATPVLDSIMLAATRMGDAQILGGLVALELVALMYTRHNRDAIFTAIAIGGAAVLNPALKAGFQRPRPQLWATLTPEQDFSFPSGHAMGSLAVVLALVVLAWPTLWRWSVIVLGTIFVVFVGVSRIYLGVHFPSDVLAEWGAALAWVAATTVSLRRDLFKRVSP